MRTQVLFPAVALALATGLVCIMVSAAGADSVIFDNITPNGGVDYGGRMASQLSLNTPFDAGAADDFVLPAAREPWAVTGVEWVGSYILSQAPIQWFNLIFWPDAGGIPAGSTPAGNPPNYSQALAVYNILGNANETAVPGHPNNFQYTADLPAPFSAQPGVRYWLEVQAVFEFPPQWFWTATNGVQGAQAVQGFDDLNVAYWTGDSFGPEDLAFTLNGTPEPAALSLLALGGAALVARRKKN